LANRYRLLVTDIDGTLLGRSPHPTPAVQRAIVAARDAGWRVVLCTGRTPASCHGLLRELGLNGSHIFLNGALVGSVDASHVVYQSILKPELILELIEAAEAADLTLELHTATRYFVARMDELVRVHSGKLGVDPEVTDLRELARRETICKGQLLVVDEEQEARAAVVAARLSDRFNFDSAPIAGETNLLCLNVVELGVSKETALRRLAAEYRVDMSEIVAVGDGSNDIPLFSCAGLSVAMGNAKAEVRNAATMVTDDVEADGLATLIWRLIGRESGGERSLNISVSE
jgi:5-amino-6-(5-phospho-D-ribitylamino)uracil phosphatase